MIAYSSAVLVSFPPTIYYFPRLGSLGLLPIHGEPAIRWYGFLFCGVVGGLAGLVLGRFVQRRPPWGPVWMIATLATLLLAWHEQSWFLR